MQTTNKKGQLVVISGPSGCGKSTVISEVRRQRSNLEFSVSYATRDPRQGEEDGVHYHFVSVEDFEQKIREGFFLEYARYQKHYYGTSKVFVEENRNAGRDVVLDIEVEGAATVHRVYPEATLIFMTTPSFAELARRLRGRNTESEEVIQGRLRRAKEEYREIPKYDYLVINDQVEKAAAEVLAIMKANDCRVSARLDLIKEDVSL